MNLLLEAKNVHMAYHIPHVADNLDSAQLDKESEWPRCRASREAFRDKKPGSRTNLDFQEQWMATPAEAGESEPLSGRARSKGKVNDMPGKDEAESDENARYSPGSVEDLYLIPTNNTLVLVRPEEQKAFYGEVVISEPLRLIKLKEGDENSAPGPENEEHYLRIEVFSPNSQFLKGQPPRTSPGYPSYQGNDFEASWFHGHPMRQTLTESPPAAMAKEGPAELLLIFSDAPRRRVAWKVIHQAQYSVCNRLFDGILKFLTSEKKLLEQQLEKARKQLELLTRYSEDLEDERDAANAKFKAKQKEWKSQNKDCKMWGFNQTKDLRQLLMRMQKTLGETPDSMGTVEAQSGPPKSPIFQNFMDATVLEDGLIPDLQDECMVRGLSTEGGLAQVRGRVRVARAKERKDAK
eukprot:s179_g4.t1